MKIKNIYTNMINMYELFFYKMPKFSLRICSQLFHRGKNKMWIILAAAKRLPSAFSVKTPKLLTKCGKLFRLRLWKIAVNKS